MNSLLLIGAGGHSKSIIDIILLNNYWKISGLIGLESELNESILGYKVIGTDEDIDNLSKIHKNAFIAIGKIGKNNLRKKMIKKLLKYNFNFPVISSPNSYVSNFSTINYGTSIGHGAIINCGVSIGKHSIINSSALIEHDSIIGNNCHISTGAIINGGVNIGDNSFIGSNVIIREGLKIPSGTVISAGKRIMGWPLLD